MSTPSTPTTGPVTLIPAGSIEWGVIQQNAKDVVALRAEVALLKEAKEIRDRRISWLESTLGEKIAEVVALRREAAVAGLSLDRYRGLIDSLAALSKAQSPETAAPAAAS
jgi:hypothetical protein